MSDTGKGPTGLTHEDVNAMEDNLRSAQAYVEATGRLMSDHPTLTDASGQIWADLHQILELIGNCIHRAYMLRPEGADAAPGDSGKAGKVGKVDKIEELKKLFDEKCPNRDHRCGYERACDMFPEDMIESRTDWDELKDYADDMSYIIGDVRNIVYRED